MKAKLPYVCALYTVKIKVAFIIHLLFLYIEKYISRIYRSEYRNTEKKLYSLPWITPMSTSECVLGEGDIFCLVLAYSTTFVLLDLELDISHMYIEEVLLKYILIFDHDL